MFTRQKNRLFTQGLDLSKVPIKNMIKHGTIPAKNVVANISIVFVSTFVLI